MWLAGGIPENFGYVGWQIRTLIFEKLCGWLVTFMRHLTVWSWQVESDMKQCGCQVGLLRHADM